MKNNPFKNIWENGYFQTSLATIVAVVAVQFVPQLEPMRDQITLIVLTVIGGMIGRGLAAKEKL